jgi:AP-1 complex subunit gamma-1
LLSTMAFLENVLTLNESFANEIINNVPRLGRIYKMIVQEHNTEYEIGGVQDPFLQVSILRLLRILRRYSNSFDKNLIEILVVSHDNVCSKISNNLKNGANAVLLECFQCFMVLEPTAQLK